MFADLKYNLLEKKSSLISCVRNTNTFLCARKRRNPLGKINHWFQRKFNKMYPGKRNKIQMQIVEQIHFVECSLISRLICVVLSVFDVFLAIILCWTFNCILHVQMCRGYG